MAGKKTILVGADLRKPKLYKDFEENNDLGLSTYLKEAINTNQIIKKSKIKNLDLIISGPVPPNPSELLIKKNMKILLQKLKSDYEYIILDTPPIGIVSDTMTLMDYSDLNIYVVRQYFTKKELLKYINESYEENKIQNVCVLLNEAEPRTAYGYGYGYGYGSYTGHGYYDEENNKVKSKKWYHFS